MPLADGSDGARHVDLRSDLRLERRSDLRLDTAVGGARAASDPGRIDDPTPIEHGDSRAATQSDGVIIAPRPSLASLRRVAALPRRPGLAGDIRYAVTAAAAAVRARRELSSLDASIAAQRERRREALIELATAAIGDLELIDPAVVAARDRLAAIEDGRARHAGTTAHLDEEIAAVRRDHDDTAHRRDADIAAAEAELARAGERLAPLQRDLTTARRRAAELRATLEHLDARLAAAEVRAANRPRSDTAAAVEVVALRNQRDAAAGEEPMLAVELDALVPRVHALEETRQDVEVRLARLRREHAEARRRDAEVLAALGACKLVEDHAIADSESERRRALEAIGEELSRGRRDALRFELSALEEREQALGEHQRRAGELREMTSSIDRGAVARGALVLAIAIASLLAAIAIATGLF